MSDMDNLLALKAMLEGGMAQKKETPEEREQRFLKEAVRIHLGQDEDKDGLMSYHPEEMIAFLEQPTRRLKSIMGGEWAEMNDTDFDLMVYTVDKKLKKSNQLLDWNK